MGVRTQIEDIRAAAAIKPLESLAMFDTPLKYWISSTLRRSFALIVQVSRYNRNNLEKISHACKRPEANAGFANIVVPMTDNTEALQRLVTAATSDTDPA